MEEYEAALAMHPQVSSSADASVESVNQDNEYEEVVRLQSGSQGTCSVVKSTKNGNVYVVKEIRGWQTSVPSKAWVREIHLLTKVLKPHLNIVRPYVFEAKICFNGKLYFEYCSGGDLYNLAEHWRTWRYEPPSIFLLQVFINLADAFAYLHHSIRYDGDTGKYFVREGDDHDPVIHCDVKPENILLRWPGTPGKGLPEVVLADFGLSRDSEKRLGIAGTITWYSPEVQEVLDMKSKLEPDEHRMMMNRFEMTTETDIYGLGLVMVGLVNRPLIRDGGDPRSLKFSKESEAMKFPLLVKRCLEVEPGKRWTADLRPNRGLMPRIDELRDIMDEHVQNGTAHIHEDYWGQAMRPLERSSASSIIRDANVMDEL